MQIPLAMVADVRIVEGPAMIKSENGMLRSYVQLNVRDRDIVGFVDEAQRVVTQKVKLPQGIYLAVERPVREPGPRRKTMQVVFPAVALVIFMILYLTYNDFVDAVLMMMCVPEALVGGVYLALAHSLSFPRPAGNALQRGRAGGIHRLLRHGHGNGHHHAGVSARGDRKARRAGEDSVARRTPSGRDRRGRPSAPAEAVDRRRGHHRAWRRCSGPRAWGTRSSRRWRPRCSAGC